jgi:kynurenine formamidase
MRLIDLTHPITTGMPVYPGDPPVTLSPALTVAAGGVNVLHLDMGSQTGTHVDAPFHIDDTLPTLDDLPLERFVGPATVLDLRGLAPRTPITPSMLPPTETGIVLLATGWSAHWGTDAYLAHPYLTEEAATRLVASGVHILGIDALSIDPTPTEALPAHRVLCGAHAVIAENLTNLDALPRTVMVSLLPIRLAAADGAPIRAVAFR